MVLSKGLNDRANAPISKREAKNPLEIWNKGTTEKLQGIKNYTSNAPVVLITKRFALALVLIESLGLAPLSEISLVNSNCVFTVRYIGPRFYCYA